MAKKVLIVDDSASVRYQVTQTLQEGGFDVLEAIDGADALAKILATPDLLLVLCDVNMPEMNGLELLERLHASASTASLPVVMLTTEGQPQLVQQAKNSGAKGWIVKPFKVDLLLSAVRKITGTGAAAA